MRSLLAGLLLLITAPVMADTAVLAGGCFWCLESDFDKLPGVSKTVSGYSGGEEKNPSYEQVAGKRTGHIEVVQITYDPAVVSYEKLLDWFWHHVDPLTANGQFCDLGPQYRTAIFVANESERKVAESSKAAIEKQLGQKVVTEILSAKPFWPAEDYHQDYAKNNPLRYNYYRRGCGRDKRLEQVWGKSAK